METPLGTVISYCTNDFRFIAKCIDEARKFSRQIIVVVCDHFFDGTPENRFLLDKTYADHPDCLFIEFAYDSERLYSPYHAIRSDDEDWAIYWAATTRYIGFYYLLPEIKTVLFLDSDEILEGEKLRAVLESSAYGEFDAMRLASYYYALRSNFRSKKVVNLPLLVKKATLDPLTLCNSLERIGAYLTHPGPKREKGVGMDGLPFVHHFSWVRTKEECYQKARTWGHRAEEDWPALIENTFAGKQVFNCSFDFEEVNDVYFDPLSISFSTKGNSAGPFSHVLTIDRRSFFEKTLEGL